MSLAETAHADLAAASASILAEVEEWKPHHWVVACEVHREATDATHLAFHLASRSRRVVRAIKEQPGSQIDVSLLHVDPTVPQKTGDRKVPRQEIARNAGTACSRSTGSGGRV
jgi:hypothetical protein